MRREEQHVISGFIEQGYRAGVERSKPVQGASRAEVPRGVAGAWQQDTRLFVDVHANKTHRVKNTANSEAHIAL